MRAFEPAGEIPSEAEGAPKDLCISTIDRGESAFAYAFAFFHLAQRALAASDIFLRAAGDICRLRPFVGPAFDDDLPFARAPPFSAAMARFRFSNCSSNWAIISAVSMYSPSVLLVVLFLGASLLGIVHQSSAMHAAIQGRPICESTLQLVDRPRLSVLSYSSESDYLICAAISAHI